MTSNSELQEKIRKLNTERLTCLRRISAIDGELRKLNTVTEYSHQRIWICSCGKEFVREDDLRHHIKFPRDGEHHRIDGIRPVTNEVTFNKPTTPTREFACTCKRRFASFIDRLIHFDEESRAGSQRQHAEDGEVVDGKRLVRDTTIKGDPIVSRKAAKIKDYDEDSIA